MRTMFLAAATTAVLDRLDYHYIHIGRQRQGSGPRKPGPQHIDTAEKPHGYSVQPDASGRADD